MGSIDNAGNVRTQAPANPSPTDQELTLTQAAPFYPNMGTPFAQPSPVNFNGLATLPVPSSAFMVDYDALNDASKKLDQDIDTYFSPATVGGPAPDILRGIGSRGDEILGPYPAARDGLKLSCNKAADAVLTSTSSFTTYAHNYAKALQMCSANYARAEAGVTDAVQRVGYGEAVDDMSLQPGDVNHYFTVDIEVPDDMNPLVGMERGIAEVGCKASTAPWVRDDPATDTGNSHGYYAQLYNVVHAMRPDLLFTAATTYRAFGNAMNDALGSLSAMSARLHDCWGGRLAIAMENALAVAYHFGRGFVGSVIMIADAVEWHAEQQSNWQRTLVKPGTPGFDTSDKAAVRLMGQITQYTIDSNNAFPALIVDGIS